MSDVLDVFQALAVRLGRAPTLEELLQHFGPGPSGTPTPQFASGPGAQGHATDEQMSALVAAQDLVRANPEILRRRDELIRELLFGTTQRQFLFGVGGNGTGVGDGSEIGLNAPNSLRSDPPIWGGGGGSGPVTPNTLPSDPPTGSGKAPAPLTSFAANAMSRSLVTRTVARRRLLL
jgi:hypothetical protein